MSTEERTFSAKVAEMAPQGSRMLARRIIDAMAHESSEFGAAAKPLADTEEHRQVKCTAVELSLLAC
jgi:hypothetical protein